MDRPCSGIHRGRLADLRWRASADRGGLCDPEFRSFRWTTRAVVPGCVCSRDRSSFDFDEIDSPRAWCDLARGHGLLCSGAAMGVGSNARMCSPWSLVSSFGHCSGHHTDHPASVTAATWIGQLEHLARLRSVSDTGVETRRCRDANPASGTQEDSRRGGGSDQSGRQVRVVAAAGPLHGEAAFPRTGTGNGTVADDGCNKQALRPGDGLPCRHAQRTGPTRHPDSLRPRTRSFPAERMKLI